MKTHFWKALLASAILLFAANGATRAQGIDNNGCSNETLTGDYTFTVSGQIFHTNGEVETRQGVAITHFDGQTDSSGRGGLKQNDFVMTFPDKNGMASPVPGQPDPVTGFHINETGSYHVNSDCTGNAEIDFPHPRRALQAQRSCSCL